MQMESRLNMLREKAAKSAAASRAADLIAVKADLIAAAAKAKYIKAKAEYEKAQAEYEKVQAEYENAKMREYVAWMQERNVMCNNIRCGGIMLM